MVDGRLRWLPIFLIILRRQLLWGSSKEEFHRQYYRHGSKEVAERMQVGPGSKDYRALSLAVQYYADAYICANVPPNCFIETGGWIRSNQADKA